MTPSRLAQLCIAIAATLPAACESPWDQPTAASLAQRTERSHEIYADAASFGKWIDKRPRSQITHGMLVIEGPKERRNYFPPNSTVVVTTTSDTIADKANELATDTLRVPAGMKTNYALGTTVDVRIERIGEGGKRTLLDESRVSFLEVVKH